MIVFSCNSCRIRLKVSDEKAGRKGKCPKCGGPITVPDLTKDRNPYALANRPVEQHPAITIPQHSVSGNFDTEIPVSKGITCPSCRQSLPSQAKICGQCGIHLPSGRPILTAREDHLDDVYDKAEKTIRPLSFLVRFGIYPIYSEAYGKSRPYAAWVITAGTILVSLWFWLVLNFSNSDSVVQSASLCMLWPDENYRYSQLLTHALLHGGLLHLAGNLLFLLVFGSRVNAAIGNLGMLIVYPLLAAAGAGAHLAFDSASGVPMLGASGAVMGLAGIYLVMFPLHKVHMAIWWRWGLIGGFRLAFKLFAVAGIWVVLFYISFDVLITLLGMKDGVAHWAHLGGFGIGILTGLLLLIFRLTYPHCNTLSLIFGRYAWPLLGRPATRLRQIQNIDK